ncbi:helix-turn-helix domain-containing protein [Salmonella enterica]|nr:helix-turn-helix domain-containing protein [Salmonella enterica]
MKKIDATIHFGTQANLAKALGITDQAVSRWPDLIPKGSALELEKITNGALKCDLDVYRQRPRKNKRT